MEGRGGDGGGRREEGGRLCYSLGPSPRPFLAIRTTARSMAGLTRQGRILLEHNPSTFQSSPTLDVHAHRLTIGTPVYTYNHIVP